MKYVIILLALFFMYVSYNTGYRTGFDEAEAIGVKKNIEHTRKLLRACSDDNSRMYELGQERSKHECQQMLDINNRLCVEDLKKAYAIGRKTKCKNETNDET